MRHHRSAVVSLFLTVLIASAAAADQSADVREVTMTDRSIVPIAARIRFFTDIVLPDPDDAVKEAACGDKDFWVVEVSDNVVRVKPAKEGATTNLGIRTASGRIYTFMLTESKAPPDVKIFVASNQNQPRSAPLFIPAAQVDALRADLARAHASLEVEARRAADAITTFRTEYPTRLSFDYGTPPYQKPFYVRALWHDGQFTYLRSDARELPALYEVVDGKPSLVNFQVRPGGLYVVSKVLDRGYLAIGKKRWFFER